MALTDNLVSYWKFDESSGNAADSVGSNTLTNYNVTFASGKINNAADYGTSHANSNHLYRSDGLGINLTGSFSVSFWLKLNAELNSDILSRPLDWRSTTGTASYILLNYQYNSGTRRFHIQPGNASGDVYYNITLGTSNWYHIVITCSSGAVTLYINNSSVATTNMVAGSAGNLFDIGNCQYSDAGGIAGLIDEAGIWSRALSTSEITQLYNSGSGLQYPFSSSVAKVVHNLGALGVGS